MRDLLWSLVRAFAWIASGGVAVASLFAAIVSIVFQASHQVIIIGSIENLFLLFWAAVGFLGLQFITRLAVEWREERTHTLKKKTIGTIGILIGEGTRLAADLGSSSPSPENLAGSTVYRDFKAWKQRTSRCINEYEPKLNDYLDDMSGLDSRWPRDILGTKIEARTLRLRELLSIIAMS